MDLKKRKTEKNRGFSIVEFLVAFGILSVIVTTVGYMMTTSSKTYSGLSTEAQLQSEAQLVAMVFQSLPLILLMQVILQSRTIHVRLMIQ